MKVWINDDVHVNFPMELPDDESVTVLDLKKEIKKETGVRVERQELFHGGKRLNNNSKLTFCGFHRDTEITLRVNPPTTELTIAFQHFTHSVEIQEDTTVYDLKQQIKNGVRVPVEKQELEYEGNILLDERTVLSYAIPHRSVLTLFEKFKIEVIHGDEGFDFLVWEGMKVEELKQMVQNRFGVPQDQMRLRLLDEEIELFDSNCLSKYNIQKGDEIHMFAWPSRD